MCIITTQFLSAEVCAYLKRRGQDQIQSHLCRDGF